VCTLTQWWQDGGGRSWGTIASGASGGWGAAPDAIQKRKNLVIKRKTKAFNSAKYYIIKTQAIRS